MINHNTLGYTMNTICIFETNVSVSIEYFFIKIKTRNSMACAAAEWNTES